MGLRRDRPLTSSSLASGGYWEKLVMPALVVCNNAVLSSRRKFHELRVSRLTGRGVACSPVIAFTEVVDCSSSSLDKPPYKVGAGLPL